MHVDFQDRLADFKRENLAALQHIDLVDPWVVEHKTSVEKTYNDRSQQWTDGDVLKEQNSCFTRWFKDKLLSYHLYKDSSEKTPILLVTWRRAQPYDILGVQYQRLHILHRGKGN